MLVPTFTMIAGYHHKLPQDLQQDMDKARQESVQWASTEYAAALAKGELADRRREAEGSRADGPLYRTEQRID